MNTITHKWINIEQKGFQKGLERGMRKGWLEGKTDTTHKFVRNMLKVGMSIKQIVEITDLSIEQVKFFNNHVDESSNT